MNWKAKAFLGRALSALPGHSTLYYLAQRHVMQSLPLPVADFRIRVQAAWWHLQNYLEHAPRPLSRAGFLEFGAGWDLTIPLVFAFAGVRDQVLLDREALVRKELVDSSLSRLRALFFLEPPSLPGHAGLPATGPGETDLVPWLASLGIQYRAPADARDTGLPDGVCDAVTNTATLEHLPAPVLAPILREMFRVLRPGGLLSCEIDPSDHFSHSDHTISPWHFLRFSERTWSRLNSGLLFQNRLRASAYVALVREAGFEIMSLELGFPAGTDIETVAMPPVHPTDVRGTDRRDLLATSIRLLGRRPHPRDTIFTGGSIPPGSRPARTGVAPAPPEPRAA